MSESTLIKFEGDFKKEVVDWSNNQSVIVDFYADWCGPCKVLSVKMDEALAQKKGKIKLVKINIDEYDSLANEFNIDSIPYVVLYQKGKKVKEFKGLDLEALKDMVQMCS
jgi:putative thioredoxin